MYIEALELKNYRNYKALEIQFNQQINIIYGDNAQGKTNLIEAIYLCATSKSHRLSFDKELIKIGEKESHIHLKFKKKGISENIHIQLNKNSKKKIAFNQIALKKISHLFGIIHVIIFSPEDLGLIKNGPKERRRFIDFELSQLNSLYMYHLSHYYKVLKQRNKLLRKEINKEEIKLLLDTWDNELIKHGFKVIELREEFIQALAPILQKKHAYLSGKKEIITIKYEKNTTIKDYKKNLEKKRKHDLIKGSTSVGPHRDDINFKINKIDVKKYGSQGQQRTAALALKLSEIELVKEKIEDTPILLLDDVLSELDIKRQQFLIKNIENIQTFITCTNIESIKEEKYGWYKVDKGQVVQLHKEEC